MTSPKGTPNSKASRGPAYQRVAHDLMEQIEQGVLKPGDKLPTEAELKSTYEVSSTTVRGAVKSLANIGLVETRHGSGSFVAVRDLLEVHATYFEDLDQRKGILSQGAWSTDVLEAGRTPTTDFECLNVAATQEQAEILGVDVGETLVMRRAWRYVDGTPTAIEASVFPQWLVSELPELASPNVIQQGTTSWLDEVGHSMFVHEDRISCRPHSMDEDKFFGSPSGVASIVRRRISFDQSKKVLRVMDTIYRSDMNEIIYEIPGSGNQVN